jgi:hypothetical protein
MRFHMKATASSRKTSYHAPVEKDIDDLDEHAGIGPVEVPLERVERRPDPAPVGERAEVAGREVREDLGQRSPVPVRELPVREDPEELGRVGVAIAGPDRPNVLGRAVVEDEVDAQADPLPAKLAGEVPQVGHGAEARLHLPIVGHGVAAVVVAGPRPQERHEVEVPHAELLEVADVLLYAAQRAGEPVHVEDVADHLRDLEPVRADGPLAVQQPQLRRSLRPPVGEGRDQRLQVRIEPRITAVRVDEPLPEVVPPAPEPHDERLDVARRGTLEQRPRDLHGSLEPRLAGPRDRRRVADPAGCRAAAGGSCPLGHRATTASAGRRGPPGAATLAAPGGRPLIP